MVGLVLACGACTDALIGAKFWWLGIMPAVLLALIAEGALFTVVTWVRRTESTAPRAVPAAVAAGLFVLLIIIGGGGVLGTTAATVILLGAASWSMFRNHRFSPRLTWLRVAVISAGAVVGSWRAWPTHRSTEDLLDVAIAATRLRATDGWLFNELRARPDAVPELERIAGPRDDDETLLLLHFALNGSSEFRRPKCERWRASPTRTPRLNAACGPVAP